MEIRPMRAGDEERLREVARSSKAHWGYDVAKVRDWAAAVQYGGKDVYVAEVDGAAVGYASLVVDGETAELDELWIESGWIGKGAGAALFEFVSKRARESGARRLEWEADPNSVGFYERMGARWLRDSEPSEWGRILPIMGIAL